MNAGLSALPLAAVIALGALVAVQVALLAVSLAVLVRTPRERLAFGRKWPWVLIVVLGNVIGPIVFLAAGRRAAAVDDAQRAEPRGDSVASAVESLYGGDRG
ncbi:PLD nuclease N-terminal domain-containing protein [Streptomyces koyangensis]|uniref:PLD nuclease N-terminal domain-containing protein n=1 Tax=Streptomyces koyangensis TaxID=188770 RepID=UPI003D003BB7